MAKRKASALAVAAAATAHTHWRNSGICRNWDKTVACKSPAATLVPLVHPDTITSSAPSNS